MNRCTSRTGIHLCLCAKRSKSSALHTLVRLPRRDEGVAAAASPASLAVGGKVIGDVMDDAAVDAGQGKSLCSSEELLLAARGLALETSGGATADSASGLLVLA